MTDDDIAQATALLATPLGLPGSGRVRYGAAMTLYRAGRLPPEALEAYRTCVALDGEDPARVHALAAGVSGVPGTADREAAIRGLVEAADQYLSGLPGPGIAEARSGIAAARGNAIDPAPPRLLPPPGQWLDPALAVLAADRPALAAAIGAAAPFLDWVRYDSYPRAEIGGDYAEGHAFASVIDPDGPIRAHDFSLGVFVIAPHVLYRDRAHPAPELYAPLTGPHGWRFGPGDPLTLRPAHVPVWNEANRPHATKVGPVPFLSIFVWTRDVTEPAYVLPAPDWADLEALRL